MCHLAESHTQHKSAHPNFLSLILEYCKKILVEFPQRMTRNKISLENSQQCAHGPDVVGHVLALLLALEVVV